MGSNTYISIHIEAACDTIYQNLKKALLQNSLRVDTIDI